MVLSSIVGDVRSDSERLRPKAMLKSSCYIISLAGSLVVVEFGSEVESCCYTEHRLRLAVSAISTTVIDTAFSTLSEMYVQIADGM